jgi:hypothetical protein
MNSIESLLKTALKRKPKRLTFESTNSHENLLVFATDEVNATAHLILHPDTFVGALIEIDTTALNKPVSPTPTAPRPQGEQ